MQIINKNKFLRHEFVKRRRERERKRSTFCLTKKKENNRRVMMYRKQNKLIEFQKGLNSADELGSVNIGGGGAFPAAAAIIANCKPRSRACCSSRKR